MIDVSNSILALMQILHIRKRVGNELYLNNIIKNLRNNLIQKPDLYWSPAGYARRGKRLDSPVRPAQ